MTVRHFRKPKDSALETLYTELSKRHLKPADLVRELRREGKKIKFLSELSLAEIQDLIEQCR